LLYTLYEMNHAALAPWRTAMNATRQAYRSPMNPLSYTHAGRSLAAAADVFEAVTRRYSKPEWNLPTTTIRGVDVPVHPRVALSKTWCDLVHFERDPQARIAAHKGKDAFDPKVLIVAPMSGQIGRASCRERV